MNKKSSFLLIAVLCVFGVLAGTITAQAANKEIVKFRLTKWKSSHFNSESVAAAQLATLKKLGCEARQHRHNGHFDVTYRCQQWRQLTLKTHKDAAKWEQWLKSNGFETRHSH